MAVVYDRVWCGYKNKIHVIQPKTMQIEVREQMCVYARTCLCYICSYSCCLLQCMEMHNLSIVIADRRTQTVNLGHVMTQSARGGIYSFLPLQSLNLQVGLN